MSLREELKDRMPRKCARCRKTITPGHDIWTMAENVYCTGACAMEAAGIEYHCRLLHDGYFDYFPKKSEDLFAREEVEK